jgi:hypothetical protein
LPIDTAGCRKSTRQINSLNQSFRKTSSKNFSIIKTRRAPDNPNLSGKQGGKRRVGEGDEQQYQQKSGSVAQVSIASRPYKLHLFSSLQGERKFPKNTRTHAGTGESVSSRD